jgi:acyl-CoA thioesterase
MRFSEASAVTRRSERIWSGYIAQGWGIFDNANGGYLLAMAARAMSEACEGRRPVSITGHFTSPGKPGPVTIEVEVLRTGLSYVTARATMTADDALILTTLGTFASGNRPRGSATIEHGGPPDLPSPGECELARPSATGPLPPPFIGQVEERIHPEDAQALYGNRTGIARMRGWFRLLDGEPMDSFSLIMASDSFPPAVFNTNLPLAWTPTLELTVHVRSDTVGEWAKCQFRTRFVTSGYLEEDGEIWDEKGNLLVQSRQLALVPSG